MAETVAFEDYYSVLQVPQSASVSTIRDAYKKRALRFHPDKNKDDNATSDFQRLSRAWDTLKDSTARANYDREYARVAKRRRCEEDGDDDSCAWRRRQEEVKRESKAQWMHQAQFSEKKKPEESANVARRLQEATIWKNTTRDEYITRLETWRNSSDEHIIKIQNCLKELRKQRAGMEKFAEDDRDIAKARASASEIPGFLEALEKMIQARKIFAAEIMQDSRQRMARLQVLLSELELDRRRFEVEAQGLRREHVGEALEMLGPRDLNTPIFSMLDRRGKAINHWKALSRVKLSTRYPASLESYAEGPWHIDGTDGSWERLSGEYKCGRCEQSTFHIVSHCSSARCPGCGLIICNDCYRDLHILREYARWLISDDNEMPGSLFSLVFDLDQESFGAADGSESKPVFGLGVAHI